MIQSLLIQLAVASGASDVAVCEKALKEAQEKQLSLIDALLDKKVLSEDTFLKQLAEHLGVPWWDGYVEERGKLPSNEEFPISFAIRHHLLIEKLENGNVVAIISDPLNLLAKQKVSLYFRRPVQWKMSKREDIRQFLRNGYGIGADTFSKIIEGREANSDLDLNQETTVLDRDDSEASIAQFVNQVIREALVQRATDIHIEPLGDDLRVRYRVDGVLYSIPVPAQIKLLQAMLISRLKIMAHLDIAEKRLPQDGRINLEMSGEPIDVRVATIPSVVGESISLRLLKQRKFDLTQIGLDTESIKITQELLTMPNGIILLTGPTGCGKSTTLYTFLSALNNDQRRIVTIEDPVEYKLPGVVQIAVKPDIGLSFASGLRSVLRGDPNVIMIGEMRDLETAETAIRAALTGHLVFSTLHTNDAVGGITRLIDLGVEPFLVASAVRAFLAQRLVRVLCPHCKQPKSYPKEYLESIGFNAPSPKPFYSATGCQHCRKTGYEGRTAILEICRISGSVHDLIAQRKPANMIKQAAMKEGMIPLRQAGFKLAQQGTTTLEEVLRVTMIDAERGES